MAMASSMRAAGKIFAEGLGERSAEGCSAEGSYDCADGSGDATDDERVVREAEGATCEGAHDDAGDELRWDRAAGGAGALVVDDLGDGEEGEDDGGDDGAEEGEVGSGEADPAEVGAPADDGGCGEGAESGDDSDEEGQDEDGHGSSPEGLDLIVQGVTYFRADDVERVSHLAGGRRSPESHLHPSS